MPPNALTVAVVGAASLIGQEILRLLGERQFPLSDLRALGSIRTAGRELDDVIVGLVGPDAFDGVDLALFAAGPTVAGEWVPVARDAGADVVDVSSRFRLDPDVPLIVPEVNAAEIAGDEARGLVASPSSTAVALAVLLAPLIEAVGVRRAVVSTYQGAAGAGRRAIQRLSRESVALLGGRGADETAARRAFNCVPQVGALEPGGITTHELQLIEETRKVLGAPELPLHVTAVRVPMFFAMAASVNVELAAPLELTAATEVLRRGRGILVHDGPEDPYPTPADVVGSQSTHVGRIREDPSAENGLSLWVALDSVEKGAALNAVQIAEILVRRLA